MDTRSFNRLMAGISVFWLILCLARLALMAPMLSASPHGGLLSTVINVLLVVGIVMMEAIAFRGARDRVASIADPEHHCPRCHARLDEGLDFCPVCGHPLDDS